VDVAPNLRRPPTVNRKVFDLIVVTALLLKPATGLLRMAARRWNVESNGAMGTIGEAVEVAL
jgi:hypothetical protein